MNTRTEKDSMGEMQVPVDAYYGATTQRAVENFPVSGWPLPPRFLAALGLVKLAARRVDPASPCWAGSLGRACAARPLGYNSCRPLRTGP